MNVLVSTSAQAHHLVQVSLEISLLHVDLLIGLNDIFQLLLPLLTLLKLDNTHKVSECNKSRFPLCNKSTQVVQEYVLTKHTVTLKKKKKGSVIASLLLPASVIILFETSDEGVLHQAPLNQIKTIYFKGLYTGTQV